MKRTCGWLVVVAVLCGVFAGVAVAKDQTYLAEYQGGLTDHNTLNDFTPPGGSITHDLKLSWDEKVYETATGTLLKRTLTVNGTFQQSTTGEATDPNSNYTCMIRQRSGTNVGDLTVNAGDALSEANVDGNIPINPGPAGDVVWTPTSDPGGVCQTYNSSGSALHWNSDGSEFENCSSFPADPNFIPGFAINNIHAGGYQHSWHGSQSMTPIPNDCDPSIQNTVGTRSINAELTVRPAEAPTPPPVKHPLTDRERTRLKLEAKLDLHKLLRIAPDLCGPTAIGLSALWAQQAGAPLSPSQAETARQMLAASGLDCIAALHRAFDEFAIAHDPPDRRFTVLARPTPNGHAAALPGCGGEPAGVRAYCNALRAALVSYVAATQRSASIADALKATVFKETGAANARNRSALKRQDARGKQLEAQFEAAVRSEAKLGGAVAHVISSHQVQGQLTEAQDATAINYVVSHLESRSIASSQITHLAGAALNPAPVDLLTWLR